MGDRVSDAEWAKWKREACSLDEALPFMHQVLVIEGTMSEDEFARINGKLRCAFMRGLSGEQSAGDIGLPAADDLGHGGHVGGPWADDTNDRGGGHAEADAGAETGAGGSLMRLDLDPGASSIGAATRTGPPTPRDSSSGSSFGEEVVGPPKKKYWWEEL